MSDCKHCQEPIEPDTWHGGGASPTGWIHASGWMCCGPDRRRSGTVAEPVLVRTP